MTTEFFSTVGKIAGLAGLCIALVLYIIFRVLKSADGNNRSGIESDKKFLLLKFITMGVFSLGGLGIITWAIVTVMTNKEDKPNGPEVIVKKDSAVVPIYPTDSTRQGNKDSVSVDSGKIPDITTTTTPFDSLKKITIQRLMKFSFKAEGPYVKIIFSSDLLNATKLLNVPVKMKCVELKEKLLNELKLDRLIKMKDRDYYLANYGIPVLKWGTLINSSEVKSESTSFKNLKVIDSSKLSLIYTWESIDVAKVKSPGYSGVVLDSNYTFTSHEFRTLSPVLSRFNFGSYTWDGKNQQLYRVFSNRHIYPDWIIPPGGNSRFLFMDSIIAGIPGKTQFTGLSVNF